MSRDTSKPPDGLRVLIVGGGVAGLLHLLRLRARTEQLHVRRQAVADGDAPTRILLGGRRGRREAQRDTLQRHLDALRPDKLQPLHVRRARRVARPLAREPVHAGLARHTAREGDPAAGLRDQLDHELSHAHSAASRLYGVPSPYWPRPTRLLS